jgi:hypothetical protein
LGPFLDPDPDHDLDHDLDLDHDHDHDLDLDHDHDPDPNPDPDRDPDHDHDPDPDREPDHTRGVVSAGSSHPNRDRRSASTASASSHCGSCVIAHPAMCDPEPPTLAGSWSAAIAGTRGAPRASSPLG